MTYFKPAVAATVEVGEMVAGLRKSLNHFLQKDQSAAAREADLRAHTELVRRLNLAYPEVPVVSEEDGHHNVARPADYFLIDPIDGTSSWAGGFAGFVCQIARIQNGIPVFGVVHAPILGRTWVAERGVGAFLNGAPMPRLKSDPLERIVVVDNYPVARGVSAELMEWLGNSSYLECGSIGLKASLVASGDADLFVKDVLVRDWDVAPAIVLISEVGGFIANPDGTTFQLSGPFDKPRGVIVARTRELGEAVASWIASRT